MKKKIIQYLKDKNIYNVGFDFLIIMLCDQITLYKTVMKTLKEEGVSVAGNAEGTYFVRNQHFKTLTECIQNINALTRKIGISPKDYNDMDLAVEDNDDEFDLMK